jgi:hypothetical protein
MSHEKFTELELEIQIQEIMKSFNFEKVELHMQNTGHQWYQGSERGMVIPDVEDLRVCARDLLTKAAYHKFPVCNVGTGGFVAYKMPWGMQLTFQLAWS